MSLRNVPEWKVTPPKVDFWKIELPQYQRVESKTETSIFLDLGYTTVEIIHQDKVVKRVVSKRRLGYTKLADRSKFDIYWFWDGSVDRKALLPFCGQYLPKSFVNSFRSKLAPAASYWIFRAAILLGATMVERPKNIGNDYLFCKEDIVLPHLWLKKYGLTDPNRCCRVCKQEDKLKACSVCLCDYYCSQDCQQADWVEHKPYCKRPCSVGSVQEESR